MPTTYFKKKLNHT